MTFERSAAEALLLAVAVGCGAPPPPAATDAAPPDLCGGLRWWNQPSTVPESRLSNATGGVTTTFDDDLAVPGSTPVQLRRDATLLAEAVYPWGWQPTFREVATGHVFRFLHLRPEARDATSVGTVYPAGTIVGLSGGDSWDTGFERPACEGRVCSTGAHLCVEGELPFAELFPPSSRACPAGSPGAVVAELPPSRQEAIDPGFRGQPPEVSSRFDFSLDGGLR